GGRHPALVALDHLDVPGLLEAAQVRRQVSRARVEERLQLGEGQPVAGREGGERRHDPQPRLRVDEGVEQLLAHQCPPVRRRRTASTTAPASRAPPPPRHITRYVWGRPTRTATMVTTATTAPIAHCVG